MRVAKPRDISLLSTNVAANGEPEWSDVTTYSQGETVQVSSSTPHRVYTSLRGNNLNRPPAESLEPVKEVATSSTSVTVGTGAKTLSIAAGKSFSAGMVVDITKTPTPRTVKMTAEVTGYDSGTGALDVNVYSSSGEGTHGDWTITSEDEIGFWQEVGSTNQWAMFDEYINTQTINSDSIEVKLDVERVDYVALFNLEAKLVEVELWDSLETELLWSGDIDLIYGAPIIAGIADWYEYFFGEFAAREDGAVDIGFITYSGVLIIRIIAESGVDAKCGNIIAGRVYDIGKTQNEASAGIVDFSKIETDDQGRTKLNQGYYAKRNTTELTIRNDRLDSIYKLLAGLRGVPTAWSANNPETDFEAFVVYGVYKDFDIVLTDNKRSICTLEIEGLI